MNYPVEQADDLIYLPRRAHDLGYTLNKLTAPLRVTSFIITISRTHHIK